MSDNKRKSLITHKNRKEITKGIFLEKYQEETENTHYYIINLEIKLFNELDFTIDLTGSKNIEIENQKDLIQKIVIDPFQKKQIAKVILHKNWNLKTKFKFHLSLPKISY